MSGKRQSALSEFNALQGGGMHTQGEHRSHTYAHTHTHTLSLTNINTCTHMLYLTLIDINTDTYPKLCLFEDSSVQGINSELVGPCCLGGCRGRDILHTVAYTSRLWGLNPGGRAGSPTPEHHRALFTHPSQRWSGSGSGSGSVRSCISLLSGVAV